MTEARLEHGVPLTAGWFVVNARDARWLHNDMRAACRFSGDGESHVDDLGIGLYWIPPGKPMSVYHHEAGQEDFLILRGRYTPLVEGEERSLAEWDFFHGPPRTADTIANTDDEPALMLAVGARKEKGSARYPFDPVAAARGAGVPDSTTPADEAYAAFGKPVPGLAPNIF